MKQDRFDHQSIQLLKTCTTHDFDTENTRELSGDTKTESDN